MTRVRVLVLRGGPSDEYDISLKTGSAVLAALDQNIFEPIDVIITKQGEWLCGGFVKYPEQIICSADVAFIALHGAYGEDGTVQRLLDRYGLRYTGSKPYPSSIAMHKALTKNHLKESGITMAPHLTVSVASLDNLYSIAESISSLFGPQYVIKPVASGSSVGVRIVENSSGLFEALRSTLESYPEVIVEKRITGREATCGIIERFRGEQVYALPPIEIVPPQKASFFDREVKYDGSTEEICPGRFSRTLKREIEQASKLVHKTLGLSQYSRSDFIVGDDGVYFLEVNTLPGLTSTSLLPKAIDAVGGTYQGFLTHLLTDALEYTRRT